MCLLETSYTLYCDLSQVNQILSLGIRLRAGRGGERSFLGMFTRVERNVLDMAYKPAHYV